MPLPSAPGTAPTWAPSLPQVGAYVPSRTRTLDATDDPTGTFSDGTEPTGTQVTLLIGDACRWVATKTGPLDDTLTAQASTVAALRAAAMVELTYPRTAEDANVAELLLQQADSARDDLAAANRGTTGVDPTTPAGGPLLPVYAFPPPVAWGDQLHY